LVDQHGIELQTQQRLPLSCNEGVAHGSVLTGFENLSGLAAKQKTLHRVFCCLYNMLSKELYSGSSVSILVLNKT
jgi:hypothetical protein